ncbi:MAG: adenylyltransferase/cytidyltransferase family protein, partial [Chordicoccus sp.]
MIQKIYDPFNYEMDTRTVVTIGKFDGIHRGHQELIRRAVRYARAETAAGRPTKSVVFSFDMAPAM